MDATHRKNPCWLCDRAFDKAEDGVHYCEERFLEVARRFGVLGLPQQQVTLEDALKAHAAHVRIRFTSY